MTYAYRGSTARALIPRLFICHYHHGTLRLKFLDFSSGSITRFKKKQTRTIGDRNEPCGRGDTTVWQGTAFSGCEISLIHNRFSGPTGTSGACNNITGQSMRVESNSTYISQLEVTITLEMIGKNIVCNHDSIINGTVYTVGRHQLNIGMYIINYYFSIYFDVFVYYSLQSPPGQLSLTHNSLLIK